MCNEYSLLMNTGQSCTLSQTIMEFHTYIHTEGLIVASSCVITGDDDTHTHAHAHTRHAHTHTAVYRSPRVPE